MKLKVRVVEMDKDQYGGYKEFLKKRRNICQRVKEENGKNNKLNKYYYYINKNGL